MSEIVESPIAKERRVALKLPDPEFDKTIEVRVFPDRAIKINLDLEPTKMSDEELINLIQAIAKPIL